MQAKLCLFVSWQQHFRNFNQVKKFFPLTTFPFFSTSGYICADIQQLSPSVLRVKLGKFLLGTKKNIFWNILFLGMLTRTVEYACDASQFSDQSYLLVTSGLYFVPLTILWAIKEVRKIQFGFDWNISLFAGGVSLSDEASNEELIKGLYHVEGDSSGLVKTPVPQVHKVKWGTKKLLLFLCVPKSLGLNSKTQLGLHQTWLGWVNLSELRNLDLVGTLSTTGS